MWFMSGNNNFMFTDYQLDSEISENINYFKQLQPSSPSTRKYECEFTVTITESESEAEEACYAKG